MHGRRKVLELKIGGSSVGGCGLLFKRGIVGHREVGIPKKRDKEGSSGGGQSPNSLRNSRSPSAVAMRIISPPFSRGLVGSGLTNYDV